MPSDILQLLSESPTHVTLHHSGRSVEGGPPLPSGRARMRHFGLYVPSQPDRGWRVDVSSQLDEHGAIIGVAELQGRAPAAPVRIEAALERAADILLALGYRFVGTLDNRAKQYYVMKSNDLVDFPVGKSLEKLFIIQER